jgi:hypothetical protein
MNTITIIVKEKIDEAAGKMLIGFEVSQAIDIEGGDEALQEGSFVPVLSVVLPHMVLQTIQHIQDLTGGQNHAIGRAPKYFSIDDAMAELKEKLGHKKDDAPEESAPNKFIN